MEGRNGGWLVGQVDGTLVRQKAGGMARQSGRRNGWCDPPRQSEGGFLEGTVTEAQVMGRLGLKPWSEVEEDARDLADAEEERTGQPASARQRSGRTWKMLVKVVVAASMGQRVVIHGHNPRYSQQLMLQAREWCETCGVDPKLILDLSKRFGHLPDTSGPDDGPAVGYWDHYMGQGDV